MIYDQVLGAREAEADESIHRMEGVTTPEPLPHLKATIDPPSVEPPYIKGLANITTVILQDGNLPEIAMQAMSSDNQDAPMRGAHQVAFYVHNKCPFPIWPATAPNTGHPVISDGGFYLPSGDTQRIYAPWDWTGRIWARTGCNFATNWQPACETGDCDGRLQCNGLIGKPPATLFQVSLQGDKGKPDFYDVSLVDGYNLPISVTSRQISPKCTVGGCSKNLKTWCPPELQVVNNNGEVVACKSACLAFNLDSFCCRNEYGIPEKCRPNVYSKFFKDACPSYYSYAFDTPAPLVSCASKEYVITFCPSSWGDQHSSV